VQYTCDYELVCSSFREIWRIIELFKEIWYLFGSTSCLQQCNTDSVGFLIRLGWTLCKVLTCISQFIAGLTMLRYCANLFYASLTLVLMPGTDEQVFYDKFLCRKFYLLVCIRNFDNFYCDKYTWASMLAFQQVYLSQYKNCQSTNFTRLYGSTRETCHGNLSTCMQLVSDLLL
jgi:hypothetical protein